MQNLSKLAFQAQISYIEYILGISNLPHTVHIEMETAIKEFRNAMDLDDRIDKSAVLEECHFGNTVFATLYDNGILEVYFRGKSLLPGKTLTTTDNVIFLEVLDNIAMTCKGSEIDYVKIFNHKENVVEETDIDKFLERLSVFSSETNAIVIFPTDLSIRIFDIKNKSKKAEKSE